MTIQTIDDGDNDLFVANDGGRWFVMQNHDTEDAEGYAGMWTEYKGNAHGYDTREEAEQALAELERDIRMAAGGNEFNDDIPL